MNERGSPQIGKTSIVQHAEMICFASFPNATVTPDALIVYGHAYMRLYKLNDAPSNGSISLTWADRRAVIPQRHELPQIFYLEPVCASTRDTSDRSSHKILVRSSTCAIRSWWFRRPSSRGQPQRSSVHTHRL